MNGREVPDPSRRPGTSRSARYVTVSVTFSVVVPTV